VIDLVKEVPNQHPEDVKNATPVNERQTDPQATDTKWLGGDELLFNPDSKAQPGKDNQAMTTNGGMKSSEAGGKKPNTVQALKNTKSLDTTYKSTGWFTVKNSKGSGSVTISSTYFVLTDKKGNKVDSFYFVSPPPGQEVKKGTPPPQ
jgi:hypothetical protein